MGAANSAIGRSLESFLGYSGRQEEIILLETTEPLSTTTIMNGETEAKNEAEQRRPGLVIFADVPRTEEGAIEYAVTWKKGQTWEGHKVHGFE